MSITDGNNNVLSIQRAYVDGVPTAIVAPFGQTTQLTLDGNGWLASVHNPADEIVNLSHQANGLLTGMTTPRGFSYSFAYDPATGYLLERQRSGGRQPDASHARNWRRTRNRVLGRTISRTTASGRTAAYSIESMRNGDRVETSVAHRWYAERDDVLAQQCDAWHRRDRHDCRRDRNGGPPAGNSGTGAGEHIDEDTGQQDARHDGVGRRDIDRPRQHLCDQPASLPASASMDVAIRRSTPARVTSSPTPVPAGARLRQRSTRSAVR